MFFSENSEKESSKEIPQNFQSGHSSELKLLPVYTGLFTGTLILSNILATKIGFSPMFKSKKPPVP